MELYSAVFVVPHTQGAQAWITEFYLQITPCLLEVQYVFTYYMYAMLQAQNVGQFCISWILLN